MSECSESKNQDIDIRLVGVSLWLSEEDFAAQLGNFCCLTGQHSFGRYRMDFASKENGHATKK